MSYPFLRDFPWHFVSMEKAKDGRDIITVERIIAARVGRPAGWFRKVIPARPARAERRQFIGECTVWHSFPGFGRAFPEWEWQLASMWEKARYEALEPAN